MVDLQVLGKGHNVLPIIAQVRQLIVGQAIIIEPAIKVLPIMLQGINEVANGLRGQLHD